MGDFHPRQIPKNESQKARLKEQRAFSDDDVIAWLGFYIESLAESGDIQFADKGKAQIKNRIAERLGTPKNELGKSATGKWVSVKKLHDNYLEYCKLMKITRPKTGQKFANNVNKRFAKGDNPLMDREKDDDTRLVIYCIPTISEYDEWLKNN